MPEVAVNGSQVSYQRRGAGAPLLALHAEDAAGQWRPLHEALAAQLDVVLPEHPGFGDAERPDWLDSIQDLAYCYLELLDQLGLRSAVHVLGESFGGWVGAELAVIAPERFRSLTLAGAMGLDVPGMPDVFALDRDQWRKATRLAEPEPEREAPSIEQLVKESRVRATLARLGWNPYLHDPRLRRWLHRASMPALVLWGEHDQLMPRVTADRWGQLLPNAKVQLIAQAGHFPAADQPQATAAAILDFLRSQP